MAFMGSNGRMTKTSVAGVALWVVQVLLALLYLLAGSMKFIMPVEAMQLPPWMAVWFVWFIGACELLGAIGLILPGLLRIRPGLTPLAASGLVIIMIGATVLSFQQGGVGMAAMPFIAGLLAAFVAYGRVRLAPQAGRSAGRPFEPAVG